MPISCVLLVVAGWAARPEPAIFDGRTFTGWYQTPPWTVGQGAIRCPTTGFINKLYSTKQINRPFELNCEIQLLRLRAGDAKGIFKGQ